MAIVSFFALCAIGVLLDCLWVVLFSARPNGKFDVVRETPVSFSFQSRVGTYTVNSESQSLIYASGKNRGTLKLGEIKDLEYRVEERHALLEEWFFGFDLTDFLSEYRDTVEWYSIAAVTSDGKRVPLYLSGQYHPREFFLEWYINAQAEVLSRLGLLRDVEAQNRKALDLIRSRLGDPQLL